MHPVLRTARLVLLGGGIAYRALFNWTTPAMYAGTLLAGPVFQLLFFSYLGRQLGVGDDRFYVVGNAVLAASLACVFGGTMAVANERRYGTLGAVLLSPRSRTAVFLGRALPYAGNGILIATFTMVAGSLLLGLSLPPGTWPGLLLAIVAGSTACAFFGLVLGAIGLRLRDLWLVSNVWATLLLLLTGVNVPAADLPAGMRAVGAVLPITHAAQAARASAGGAGLGAVLPDLAIEVAIGVGYALLAAVLLRVFEVQGRRHAALDAM